MNAVLKLNPEKRHLAAVPVERLADMWPKVSGFIEAALDFGQGDENILDIFVSLSRGAYQLWTDGESMAAVVQFSQQPRQSVCTILYAGGDLTACYRAFQFAKEYCKQRNIDVVRIWGRPGWQRVLGLESIGSIMQVRI